MKFVARILDGDSATIEEIETSNPREVEDFVRAAAAQIVVVDDERYDGDGGFVAGSIEWFTREDD